MPWASELLGAALSSRSLQPVRKRGVAHRAMGGTILVLVECQKGAEAKLPRPVPPALIVARILLLPAPDVLVR